MLLSNSSTFVCPRTSAELVGVLQFKDNQVNLFLNRKLTKMFVIVRQIPESDEVH